MFYIDIYFVVNWTILNDASLDISWLDQQH